MTTDAQVIVLTATGVHAFPAPAMHHLVPLGELVVPAGFDGAGTACSIELDLSCADDAWVTDAVLRIVIEVVTYGRRDYYNVIDECMDYTVSDRAAACALARIVCADLFEPDFQEHLIHAIAGKTRLSDDPCCEVFAAVEQVFAFVNDDAHFNRLIEVIHGYERGTLLEV